MTVRHDEAAAAAFEAEALKGEPRLEFFPATGLGDILTHRVSDDLVERHVAGAIPSAELARGQRLGPVGPLLTVELVVVARNVTQREVALLLAQ